MDFDIENIAELSNLYISDDEKEAIKNNMKEIIEFIEKYGKGNY